MKLIQLLQLIEGRDYISIPLIADHDAICVWLNDTEYLLRNSSQYCIRREEDPDEHMG